MANDYLSKRELTEMITREVKAALAQPNRRTIRESEITEMTPGMVATSATTALGGDTGHWFTDVTKWMLKSKALKGVVDQMIDPDMNAAEKIAALKSQLQAIGGASALGLAAVIGGLKGQQAGDFIKKIVTAKKGLAEDADPELQKLMDTLPQELKAGN